MFSVAQYEKNKRIDYRSINIMKMIIKYLTNVAANYSCKNNIFYSEIIIVKNIVT